MHYTLCDYVLDVFHNAIEAGAGSITLELQERTAAHAAVPVHRISVAVKDNGCGMAAAARKRALDPFWSDGKKHPVREMGFGLPFLAQVVDATGGELCIASEPGQGTTVSFAIDCLHVDAPPVGDVPTTLMQMLCFSGCYEALIERRLDYMAGGTDADGFSSSYRLDRGELRETLGELESVASLSLLRRFIEQQEAVLHGVEV